MSLHDNPASDDRALLAGLLPANVVLRQCWRDDPAVTTTLLHPDEQSAVARAVPARQREFAAGRHCARQALRALTGQGPAVPARADRSPLWPAGVVGSISHDDGLAAAAVAWQTDVAALGIDLDRIARFDDRLAPTICTTRELAAWQVLAPAARLERLALLFCAKEAVYKAQHPLTGAWLDFDDLELDLPARGGGPFTATLQRAVAGWPAGEVLTGQCALSAQRVAAVLVLRPQDLPGVGQNPAPR